MAKRKQKAAPLVTPCNPAEAAWLNGLRTQERRATVKQVGGRAFSFPTPARKLQYGVKRCEVSHYPHNQEYAVWLLTMKHGAETAELSLCDRHHTAATKLERYLDLRDERESMEALAAEDIPPELV